ncbi:MAG: hypothetical protein RRY29_02630 [Desulfovibrionaceae bacterium]
MKYGVIPYKLLLILYTIMNAAPKEVRENIARAKGYLRRNEIPRALKTMSSAIRGFADVTLPKASHAELVMQCTVFLSELNRHPYMQRVLDPECTGKPRYLAFQYGKAKILATVLEALSKMLINAAAQNHRATQEAQQHRKVELIETGKARFQSGEIASARSFLKRAAAEFGQEVGTLLEIGHLFNDMKQFQDAAEIFESALAAFPKEAEAYAEAIEANTTALEFAKAEKIYFKIFRQFGGHPKTYGRLAKLYLVWNKNQQADEFARQALQLDSQQTESLEVLSTLKSQNT